MIDILKMQNRIVGDGGVPKWKGIKIKISHCRRDY